MEDLSLNDLRSPKNPKARIKLMRGHFAGEHAHVNTYIDISTVTCRFKHAMETARVLSDKYLITTKIDTIVCLDGTRLIGAFLAEILSKAGVGSYNDNANISVITPEIVNRGQMIFRDNTRRMVEDKDILILAGSITTGENVLRAVSAAIYYKGRVTAIASIFSAANKVAGIEVNTIFTLKDVHDYEAYSASDCPLCRKGIPIDAIVSSYGYSLL